MHGNVWEWCADTWHDNYECTPGDATAWISEINQVFKVLRGGSWINNPQGCRSASRDNGSRDERGIIGSNIGFRVVCVVGRN
jgi:formylglycine-generating enzyme required for sulfatase activity